MKIYDLNISADAKATLRSIGLTEVSELEGQNYISLIDKFPSHFNLVPIINELNTLGYLLPPENEVSIYDVSMSKRLQNALMQNGIMYLSQLSSYPKETILKFRNLGEKTVTELEKICKEYHIELRSMRSVKEYFDKYKFPAKIHPLLFQNKISRLEDFKSKTAIDLYHICQEDYCLTMRIYLILRENKIELREWQDKFIFEILPEKEATLLWKKHKISLLSQIPDCNENELKQSISPSNSFSKTIENRLSIG